MGKLICLAYVHRPFTGNRSRSDIITNDYILSSTAKYEIDIAGTKFPVTPKLYTPFANITMQKVLDETQYMPKVIARIQK